MFVVLSLKGIDYCAFDAMQLLDGVFHLRQTNAVAANFNAGVGATHILQEPFRVATGQVAGTKLPHPVTVAGKALGRERRLPPIPCGQITASDDDLPHFSRFNGVTILIK